MGGWGQARDPWARACHQVSIICPLANQVNQDIKDNLGIRAYIQDNTACHPVTLVASTACHLAIQVNMACLLVNATCRRVSIKCLLVSITCLLANTPLLTQGSIFLPAQTI